VNYFENFGEECHLLKYLITSLVSFFFFFNNNLVSLNIRDVNIIYPIFFIIQ
jgi:hypothetical protein